MKRGQFTLSNVRLAALFVLASAALPPLSRAQAPVFVITPEESTIKFYVKSSVDIEGSFRQVGRHSNIYVS
jgi:hypothetical protein